MVDKLTKIVIGRAEPVEFSELGIKTHARIDTGARTSAIWGSARVLDNGNLAVRFMNDAEHEHIFTQHGKQAVSSSTGHVQLRHTIKLLVGVGSKKIRATFTIADRSTQVYPVLIGRNVLRGKFIVDVKVGTTLIRAERQKLEALEQMSEGQV